MFYRTALHKIARAIASVFRAPILGIAIFRAPLVRRSGRLWVVLVSALMLSGCVHYDVGVNFESPNRGAIVQHIRLDERLTTTGQVWLDDVEKRVRSVQGDTQRLSDQEVLVTIPFGNGAELERKFNQFFSRAIAAQKPRSGRTPDLPKIDSHLTIQQGNFLLLQRTRLIYDVDLRSLGVQSSEGELLLSPGSLIELEFSLTTPWGARNMGATIVRREGNQLIWTLQPGQKNHLESAFWLPSPLGIGTLMIALLVAGGIYFKANFKSHPPSQPVS
ncbi:MAG: DUF3153 domain-containing protein [Leptolyngbyaceae cyanobacterium CSU_1_3]|nr:DUF3153 domain-containing protein [Leptolyngbyaceae cyanobacterium CSU_1_3]